jgi:hypothetical protein
VSVQLNLSLTNRLNKLECLPVEFFPSGPIFAGKVPSLACNVRRGWESLPVAKNLFNGTEK